MTLSYYNLWSTFILKKFLVISSFFDLCKNCCCRLCTDLMYRGGVTSHGLVETSFILSVVVEDITRGECRVSGVRTSQGWGLR